jgi:hypothetical protein
MLLVLHDAFNPRAMDIFIAPGDVEVVHKYGAGSHLAGH